MTPEEQEFHEKRYGGISHTLLWVTARNRQTGAAETLGLWTGEDDRVFTIGGQERPYFGPSVIDHDPIDGGVGLDVRMVQVRIPGIDAASEKLLREFEPRFAPVEMHVAVFGPATMNLVSPPQRRFKGTIDDVDIPTPAAGNTSTATLTLASAARVLTRTLPIRQSDADQREVLSNDRGREYSAVTGLREVPWGEGKVVNRR